MSDNEKKTYDVKVEKTLHLAPEDIEDLMSAALCGGIGYWACLDNSLSEWECQTQDDCIDEYAAKILMDGGELVFIDEEDEGQRYRLTIDLLLYGVKRFIELGYDRYGAFTSEKVDMCNIDSDCADNIVQLALFNEIVYG